MFAFLFFTLGHSTFAGLLCQLGTGANLIHFLDRRPVFLIGWCRMRGSQLWCYVHSGRTDDFLQVHVSSAFFVCGIRANWCLAILQERFFQLHVSYNLKMYPFVFVLTIWIPMKSPTTTIYHSDQYVPPFSDSVRPVSIGFRKGLSAFVWSEERWSCLVPAVWRYCLGSGFVVVWIPPQHPAALTAVFDDLSIRRQLSVAQSHWFFVI